MTPVTLTALLWTVGQSADAVIPVTPAGVELRKALDAMDVEHRWLPDKGITAWKTGETDVTKKAVPRTHCSIFVAAACNKLSVPILEPEPQLLLANRQQTWLEKDGVEKGWKEVTTPLDAQTLANRGVVVVATWRNPNPKKAGHVAVVRPAEVRPSDLVPGGPRITQAGGTNANDTDVKTGFKNHPGAFEKNEIRYFAYKPAAMNTKQATGGRVR